MDGSGVTTRLAELRGAGASRDDLMEAAVEGIAAASAKYDWVGIYLLDGDALELQSFRGAPTEHTRIAVGHGVCGTAVAENRDINVPDVRELDNYIACSVGTRSEIVVLIRDADGVVRGQLDLDSDTASAFDDGDERELKVVADWLGSLY